MSRPRIVYQGKIFTITKTKIIGEDGLPHEIEKCERPDVVTIIGITAQKEVILIKEFRPGMKRHVFWLPGGRISKGENPREAAIREFREETGLYPEEISIFHKKYPSDTFSGNGYVYLARKLKKDYNVQIGDEKSKIKVVITPVQRAIQLVSRGSMPNEFFYFLLMKLERQLKIR